MQAVHQMMGEMQHTMVCEDDLLKFLDTCQFYSQQYEQCGPHVKMPLSSFN